MAQGRTFLGWIAGGVGITIIYSAYKNESPVDVLTGTLNGDKTRRPLTTASIGNSTPTGVLTNSVSTTSDDGSNSPSFGVASSVAIKTGLVQPTLVAVGSQPNLKLEKSAAKSFADVEKTYGRNIPLNNTYRSYAEQAASYARNPALFGKPGTSNHELGLALDIEQGTDIDLDDPKLIYAFVSNGWFRRGKTVNYNGKKRREPWHWSYGVPG